MFSTASTSTTLAVGTTSVATRPSSVCALILTPAAAASTVTIYDNAAGAASGKVILALSAVANGSSVVVDLSHQINGLNGLTAVVAGAGATAYIAWLAQ